MDLTSESDMGLNNFNPQTAYYYIAISHPNVPCHKTLDFPEHLTVAAWIYYCNINIVNKLYCYQNKVLFHCIQTQSLFGEKYFN